MRKLQVALLVALAVRVCLALATPGSFDVHVFGVVADSILENGPQSLYRMTPRFFYPYPPVWVWVEVLVRLLAVNFPFAIRLPGIIGDLAIIALLWKWTGKIYVLGPVALLITVIHGQFDSIPIFFCLLSVYWFQKKPDASALALAAGICFKSFPVLLLPAMLLRTQHKLRYCALALIPVCLILIPFISPFLIRELFNYQGVAQFGPLVPIRSLYILLGSRIPDEMQYQILSVSRLLFVILYSVTIFLSRRESLPKAAYLVFITFYTFYAGIGPQYLYWALPFALLQGEYLFSILATTCLFITYIGWMPETLLLDPVPTWISRIGYGFAGTVFWFYSLYYWLRGIK